MGASTEELRVLVEGHVPASPREVEARQRFLSELAGLGGAVRRARRPHPRDGVRHRGRSARHRAAPPQAARHLDAARRPHRSGRAPRRGCVARGHRGARSRGRASHRRARCCIHLDVHEAAHGHTHLDLRYLLLGADADPMPPPDESPDARWCSWDEALAMADPGLIDALPLARAAYEAMP